MQSAASKARTPREFLQRQQELESLRLLAALQALGDDLERASDLERRVRSHPVVACGLAAAVGFALGPRVLPGLVRALSAAGLAEALSARPGSALRALVPDILRARLFGGDGRGPPF